MLSTPDDSSDELLRRFDGTEVFPDDMIVLVGAGRQGKVALQGLRRAGIEPLAFADINPALWHSSVGGVEVLSEEEAAARYGYRAVFVVTVWNAWGRGKLARIRERLHLMNCPRVVSLINLFWKFPDAFLPYFCIDLPEKTREHAEEILAAYALWADESSRRQYLAELQWRLFLDFSHLTGRTPYEQYFPDDLFTLTDSEVFVDCGAYDGDTLRSFFAKKMDAFRHIEAIEADSRNFSRLTQYVTSLPDKMANRIGLHEVALGATWGTVNFDESGTRSSTVCSEGPSRIDAAPLDGLLGEHRPTYIKMDIEGSEYEALEGSRDTIRRWVPVLAISVYHRPEDMWRIPLLLAGLSDDYRLYLRPHKLVCWDLLCYAVPGGRLISRK